MEDARDVRDALKCLSEDAGGCTMLRCPYKADAGGCRKRVLKDAAELIDEQEEGRIKLVCEIARQEIYLERHEKIMKVIVAWMKDWDSGKPRQLSREDFEKEGVYW